MMTRWFATRLLLASGALLVLLLTAGGLLDAQDAKPAAPAAVGAKKGLIVHAAHGYSKQTGKVVQTTLSDAEVIQDDSKFNAKNISIESEDKVHTITCTGDPVFTDLENRITGDKVIGQSTPRWAEFLGNVKMVSTPKKKDSGDGIKGKLSGEPTTVTCETMHYDYGKKTAQAKGSVVVVQKNRTVWADQGVYEQKAELITLSGNIRIKNTGEEEIKSMKNADKMTVSLNDDWVDVTAKPGDYVEWTLEYQDEEAPADKPAPAPAPKGK
jgi:lipopolysaccharide assembly outer membrane protein LptD (OstA)